MLIIIREIALKRDQSIYHFSMAGFMYVELPYALSKKYPDAKYGWGWQYVFPAKNISTEPRSGARRRHQISKREIRGASFSGDGNSLVPTS